MCCYQKEWLLDPRTLHCCRYKTYDLLLCINSNFVPLFHGSSNIYSLGASYAVKRAQLFARTETVTGTFDVHTPTGNIASFYSLLLPRLVSTRCSRPSGNLPLGICIQTPERNLLYCQGWSPWVSYEATSVLGF